MSEEGAGDADRREYEFRKVLEELEDYRGSGTQLVSIYVPPDAQISDVVDHVRQERSEASNIKSKDTRTNVQDALASIESRLRYYDQPPENGMVLFSGAVDAGGGQTTMVTEVLENPPRPVESFRYHCDANFLLDPLEGMFEDEGLYGLIVLDRREATVGWLRGKRTEAVKNATSLVPGKQRKGGQSAQRFHRLRLEAIDKFYQEVAEMANELFVPERHELDGVLVGGPSPTKDEFLDSSYLHHEVEDKVLGKFDVSYTDESGLDELVTKAQDALADAELMADKGLMDRFFNELHEGGLATYGFEATRENLVMGSVETLLLSEDLRTEVLVHTCEAGHETIEFVDRGAEGSVETCERCGAPVEATDREDAIDHLIEIAETRGSAVAFISTDFERGEQLMTAFGGVAALLRYETGV
ncbi:MAG: peptide chain release factor aRF-1 [Halobacteriales archaeon]